MSDDEDMEFRTLAAPGLEEDDVFAALYGLPGSSGMWGEGMPDAFAPVEVPWDPDRMRRERMRETLNRWPVQSDVRHAEKD